MTILDAAAILNADDRKTKTITVPEWGGDVIVRELTGDERDSYEAAMTVQKGDRLEPNPIGTRARLVVRSLVGEDGARLFADNQAGALGQKSGGVLDRLWDEIAALSGMTPTAIADAEGNSETVPSDGSTSSEPTPPESL